jgi:hypothetical protein
MRKWKYFFFRNRKAKLEGVFNNEKTDKNMIFTGQAKEILLSVSGFQKGIYRLLNYTVFKMEV